MLRKVLMAFGCVVLVIGVALLCVTPAWPAGIPPTVIGALIVGSLTFERHHYHASVDTPPNGPDWEMLSERFVEHETEELTIVWYNRRTGKRLYVRSGAV